MSNSVLKNENIDHLIAYTSAITGGDSRKKQLLYQLKGAMSRALEIDIMVSFLMESGVWMLLDDLKSALDRGVRVRILTGNYLGITQPSALYLLKRNLGDRVELRFYNRKNRSFHAKAYMFTYEEGADIFIGSSNVSKSALTSGIEWNYRLNQQADREAYRSFRQEYIDLFDHHSVLIDDAELKRYSASWHKPAAFRDLQRYEDDLSNSSDSPDAVDLPGTADRSALPGASGTADRSALPGASGTADLSAASGRDGRLPDQASAAAPTPIFRPRGAQIEALYSLQSARAEGAGKALVQMATGAGKTFLAAFDSRQVNADRVLFVAHREEILKQAADTFRKVWNTEDIGFFMGQSKDLSARFVFASVASLGKAEYLRPEYFSPDAFDYIVVDEFHHAVSAGYKRIIKYFTPGFLLGLTATPERMDGRDIYELCDYNVPYELNLRDAINKGMLCPFHYYGIYDDTDYSGLHIVRGHYDEAELNEKYIGNVYRYDLIYKYYMKYASRRALGFCCSRRHAEDMAREFSSRGIAAAAVYSGEGGAYALDRGEALAKLHTGELAILFTVDMFNEGLDIPDLDMVLFLRPTESPVVFLQQLGRGLRKAKGKDYLNILDFIGNYERAGNAPLLLSGDGKDHGNRSGDGRTPRAYPDDCIVDFDMRLIDLFRKMNERSLSIGQLIDQEVLRIYQMLGRAPSRMELFSLMSDDIYHLCMTHSAKNPFRNYLGYLQRMKWLSAEDMRIYDGIGREFLNLIETTNMSKVYKMPILLSFCQENADGELRIRSEVTDSEVLATWKSFFANGCNWRDFDDKLSFSQFREITDRKHLKKARSMPIHFLLESGKGFFVKKDGYALAIREDLKPILEDPAFARHFKDIVDYRVIHYYRSRYLDKEEHRDESHA